MRPDWARMSRTRKVIHLADLSATTEVNCAVLHFESPISFVALATDSLQVHNPRALTICQLGEYVALVRVRRTPAPQDFTFQLW